MRKINHRLSGIYLKLTQKEKINKLFDIDGYRSDDFHQKLMSTEPHQITEEYTTNH